MRDIDLLQHMRAIFLRAFPSAQGQKGITLLLVVVLLSAILSISVGIFNVVIGEFRISGELSDSFQAFYAANEGFERAFYQDFQQSAFCTETQGPDCYVSPSPVTVASGACYIIHVSKVDLTTTIDALGQYQCGGNPLRIVRRRLAETY